ncbi:MAG: O-antigen ligase family protein [Candidatus Omnitrophota bacterium]|jgi:O-antigen ligase
MQKILKYLDKITYWSIVLLPFSIAIAPPFTYAMISFLVVSFTLKKMLKKEKLFINTSINLPFLLLIFISLISCRNSIDYLASSRWIIRLFQNAFIFLICAEEIKERKHINRIILFIVLGAFLASFDGLWQYIFGKDFIRGHSLHYAIGIKRASAAFPSPAVFGIYLSAIVPLIAGLTLFYFKGGIKVRMAIVSILVVASIIFSGSRGTVLGFYAALLFLSICKRAKIVIVSLLIVLLLFPFVIPQSLKDWFRDLNYNPVVFIWDHGRISLNRNSLNMIKHHPFIGVGIGNFSQNYGKYKLPEIGEDYQTNYSMYAHNNFLQITGETGLFGLIVFLWLLFRLVKKNIDIYKRLKEGYYKIISLCLLACILAFLINGLTETSLYYSRVAMIFWYLIGFSLALEKFIPPFFKTDLTPKEGRG